MTELVKQEDQFGCAPACLAMVLGLTYVQATRLVPPGFISHGTATVKLQAALIKKGYSVDYRHGRRNPFAPIHLAVISTDQSTDSDALRHVVVLLSDGTVLDPSGTTYPTMPSSFKVHYTLGLVPPRKDP